MALETKVKKKSMNSADYSAAVEAGCVENTTISGLLMADCPLEIQKWRYMEQSAERGFLRSPAPERMQQCQH